MLTYADRDDAFAFDADLAEELAYEQYVREMQEQELLAAQAQAQQDENDAFWTEEEPTYFLEEGWNDSTAVVQSSTTSISDANEDIVLTTNEVFDLYMDNEPELDYLASKGNVKVKYIIQHVHPNQPLTIEVQLMSLEAYLLKVGHLLRMEKEDIDPLLIPTEH